MTEYIKELGVEWNIMTEQLKIFKKEFINHWGYIWKFIILAISGTFVVTTIYASVINRIDSTEKNLEQLIEREEQTAERIAKLEGCIIEQKIQYGFIRESLGKIEQKLDKKR
jgi:hypothetical protein